MTREEAIKVLEMFLYKQCDLERTKFAYDELTVWDAVKMASEALAQPEPKWIPVRERLPEINKPVLVWVYDEYYLSELHSIGGVLYWDFDQFDLCGDEFNDVIAWMPLPKLYKEG